MRITFIGFIFLIACGTVNAQELDYNLSKGYLADGYDVLSYFNDEPLPGKEKFTFSYDGIKLKFSSLKNLDAFVKEPEKYLPAYGGWCAYAMGTSGEKVSIDPKTFEIRDGKLYLFYNKFFTNTFESWLEENPEKLKQTADKNWEKIKIKKRK